MADEIFEVTENGEVNEVGYDDYEDDAEEEGMSVLGFLIAAGIGAGAGYGLSKLVPKLKAKKLERDKKKLEKLQSKIEKAESEEVDIDDLEELTEEETAEIKKLEEEAKTNKKSKK